MDLRPFGLGPLAPTLSQGCWKAWQEQASDEPHLLPWIGPAWANSQASQRSASSANSWPSHLANPENEHVSHGLDGAGS